MSCNEIDPTAMGFTQTSSESFLIHWLATTPSVCYYLKQQLILEKITIIRIERDTPTGKKCLFPHDRPTYQEVKDQDHFVEILASLDFPAALAKQRKDKINKLV